MIMIIIIYKVMVRLFQRWTRVHPYATQAL